MKDFNKNLNLGELFFAVIFIFSPFYYQPNIGGTGLMIPSNVTVWTAVTLFMTITAIRMLCLSTFIWPKHIWWVLAFPFLATLSGFIAGVVEPTSWLFRFLFLWGGIFFFLSLYQYRFGRAQKDKLFFYIILSGLLHGTAGLLQLLQPEGSAVFLPSSSPIRVATGVFQQNNVHAVYQVTVVIIATYLISRPLLFFNKLYFVITLITVSLSVYLVVSSGSRVGVVSLCMGLLLSIFTLSHQIKRYSSKYFLFAMVIILSSSFAMSSDGFKRFEVKATELISEDTGSDRLGIYLVSTELIKNKPFFGYGIGSFGGVWQFQKADFQERNQHYPLIQLFISHPHNELLLWQVEGGILASIGILISFFAIVLITIRKSALYILPMLFPIAFHNQVELPFHISSILWFLCLALIFIGLSHCGENNKVFKTTKYVKIFLAIFFSVLMLMAILFFIKTLNSGKEFVFATSANPERPADMMLPLENLYFNKLAEDFVMQNVFNLSNQNHSIEGIREFNNWQKKAIVGRPTEFNYKLLISSYQTLNDKPAACEAAKNAHYMYLSNVEFKRYYEYCNK